MIAHIGTDRRGRYVFEMEAEGRAEFGDETYPARVRLLLDLEQGADVPVREVPCPRPSTRPWWSGSRSRTDRGGATPAFRGDKSSTPISYGASSASAFLPKGTGKHRGDPGISSIPRPVEGTAPFFLQSGAAALVPGSVRGLHGPYLSTTATVLLLSCALIAASSAARLVPRERPGFQADRLVDEQIRKFPAGEGERSDGIVALGEIGDEPKRIDNPSSLGPSRSGSESAPT